MTSLTLKRYILKHLLIDNYKRDYRLSLTLPKYLNDTLIGLILSDGGLQRSSETSNVRLSVIMSIINCPYFFHLYNLFEPYIDNDLNILDIKVPNKQGININYFTVRFKTISMPQLLYYYNIFYKKNNKKNKWEKIVPIELKQCFNPISLAHLIMGDGNYLKEKNIIRIFTNSFVKNDVELLSRIIKDRIGINSKVIYDRNNQYIIVIEKDDIIITRNLLLPFMHPSMLYKLGIKNQDFNYKFNYLNIINDI